jgi:hypothetical protein
VRGVVVMVGATAALAAALALVWPPPFAPGASVGDAAVVGLLLGAGYIAGELPNSFVKRQLDIAPGGQARGVGRVVGAVVDQLDSLVGALAALAVVRPMPLAVCAVLVVVTLVVHPLVGALMVALGLKKRVG